MWLTYDICTFQVCVYWKIIITSLMLVNLSVTSHSYESVCVWYKHLRFALVTTFKYTSVIQYCSLVTLLVKNLAAMLETWIQSLERGRSPGEGSGQRSVAGLLSTPVFLPRELRGQRSLAAAHGVAKCQT